MTITMKAFSCARNFRVADDMCTVTVDKSQVPLANSLIQWIIQPLTHHARYYEVELLQDCQDNYYMIGTNNELTNTLYPCWNMYLSIRYRSTEGGVYTGGEGLRSDNSFGKAGDKITVYLEESFLDKSLINFFLNGCLVYRQWVKVKPGQLYPAIGVSGGPAKFRVKWPGSDRTPTINLISFRSSLTNWLGFRMIEKDDSLQTLTITGHDERARLAYSIQAPRPLDADNNYFEVELLTRKDTDIGPAIGLTSAFTSKFQYPGWKPDTIGYHADDGRFYNEAGESNTLSVNEKLVCGVSHRMGCGIVFDPRCKSKHRIPQLVLVYFTRNGSIVYKKIRRLPEGGFYPTVGLFAIGECVRLIASPLKPFIPPDFRYMFDRWLPVYADFRFNESIVFEDFEATKLANTICLTARQDHPKLIQCCRIYEDECFYKITINEIGESTEIHVGAALRDIKRQGTHLRVTPPTAIYLSKKNERTLHIREGDTICTCIMRDKPGLTSINFLINNKVGFRLEAKHNLAEFFYPTICFLGGTAQLHVIWPNDPGISVQEKNSTLDGGMHASDEASLQKLLHGDRDKNKNREPAPSVPEVSPETQAMIDEVPGPAHYEDSHSPRRRQLENKKKSSACSLS